MHPGPWIFISIRKRVAAIASIEIVRNNTVWLVAGHI